MRLQRWWHAAFRCFLPGGVMHDSITMKTHKGVYVLDVTDQVNAKIAQAGIRDGVATVSCLHTTTGLTVNENEARLLDDVRLFLGRLAPPTDYYLHNDIHLRDCPEDEPENAHAHLAAMMLGNSEAIPIQDGRLRLGRWQALLFVELDGPRERMLALHFRED